MAERVEPMHSLVFGDALRWDPNAPEACLLSDDFARAALAQRAHPDDSDQRCVVLRWDMALLAQLGPPNDEARQQHRLYEVGLRELLWVGVVRDSELVAQLRPMWTSVGDARRMQPMHYVVPSKECVVEVVAADVELFRFDGTPREAAVRSLGSASIGR